MFYSDTTPEYLLPQMGGTPVTEPAIYRSLFIIDTVEGYLNEQAKPGEPTRSGEGHSYSREVGKPTALVTTTTGTATAPTEIVQPLDPFADDVQQLQHKPAIGVLTVHHQGWEQRGLALGNLLHSVCLAPGEVTQVAVVDWRRQSAGSSSDRTDQGETVTSDIAQARAVNEVQQAVAREAQAGGSSTSASSTSTQAGGSVGGLFFGGSASTATTSTSALTAQFSTGTRDLAAESSHSLTQSTVEKSQALRSRRASVVKEVTEQETETTTARVLANYNRRHALNVEYFEVLQLYQIKTRLVGWERCLFIPLQPIDFSNVSNVLKHRPALVRLFQEAGQKTLADDLLSDDLPKLVAAMSNIHAQQLNLANTMAAELPKQIKATIEGNADNAKAATVKIEAAQAALTKAGIDVAAISKTPHPVLHVLRANNLSVSQQIWLRMDPFTVYRMLQNKMIGGKPVSTLLDPHPLGVFGNLVAFRWGFDRSEAGAAERAAFERSYLKQNPTAGQDQGTQASGEGMVVAVPTSGVFAEAILGRGEAAETIDHTKFWEWEKSPIPILPPKIAEVVSRDRAKGMDLHPTQLAAALAALRAQNPSDASYIGTILGQLGKGDMFRNMGGLAEAVSLADKVATLSGEGATAAGERAVAIQAKILDTFVEVLNSDVGKAAVAEFMLPGAGPMLLNATNGHAKKSDGEDKGKSLDTSVLGKVPEMVKPPAS